MSRDGGLPQSLTADGVSVVWAVGRYGVPEEKVTIGRMSGDWVPYAPVDLQSAYDLTSYSGSLGQGETVALIDAYDDPSAESDLAVYRQMWGLPRCGSAGSNPCFRKVNQSGQAGPLPSSTDSLAYGWSKETSLDLDMVSAICPLCHILLVEADSQSEDDLAAAAQWAGSCSPEPSCTPPARFISNSWAWPEIQSYNAGFDFEEPGVVYTAASGDYGYEDYNSDANYCPVTCVGYPASSAGAVAVGGTSLLRAGNARGWDEIAWSGAGSGCSLYTPKPPWQGDADCTGRTVADVSAVADPETGVAVYDTDVGLLGTPGWTVVGGTSVASPIIASIYALGGNPPRGLTTPAQFLYNDIGNAGVLNDVVAGTNYLSGTCSPLNVCMAQPGYDGPTGVGTPNGIAAFTLGPDVPQSLGQR